MGQCVVLQSNLQDSRAAQVDDGDLASRKLAGCIARVAQHDRQAFRDLYDATSATLFGVAIGLLHDRARAEEVLQESYVRVWHGARGFDARIARPMTWLISIVRNRAIDLLRAERQERAATVSLPDEDIAKVAALATPPEQQLQRALDAARIERGLRDLPRHQRQALALVLYRGMTHAEVAAAAKVPLGTAKSWVRRGLARLQECMGTAPA